MSILGVKHGLLTRASSFATSGIAYRAFSSTFRVFSESDSFIFDPTQLNPLNSKQKLSGGNSRVSGLSFTGTTEGKPRETGLDRQRLEQVDPTSMLSPKEDALTSRVTGVRAGRTVNVFNGDTSGAFRQLNSIVFANRIAQDRRSQRFYLKPGKAKEMRRSQRHRRDFMKGFKRLIEVVKDANRKGY
ncbi:LAMI_0D04808g1_1 [Lachancea mirantina]|uniref:LAMI_0D04808g1_1 n=1 Tax=Lachancea mirantina TaxID=1230905 RepID=A0A1G4JAM0_9SACH|nr:LAMI_0D04808g1_1 [Lachancea mirantina]